MATLAVTILTVLQAITAQMVAASCVNARMPFGLQKLDMAPAFHGPRFHNTKPVAATTPNVHLFTHQKIRPI